MISRYIGLAYAIGYFISLSFFGQYIVAPILSHFHLSAEALSAIGLLMILAAIPMLIFTPLLVSCIFLAVAGLSVDSVGLSAASVGAVKGFSLVLANVLLVGVVVLVHIKATRIPLTPHRSGIDGFA